MKSGEIRFSDDGRRLVRRTYLRDMTGGLPPSSLWADLDETGHNRQAKYELKGLFPDVPVVELFGTPKPEKLIHKILRLASDPGDLVLDSFAGSGTTGAVSHKMGRRWIMVEFGAHCMTHIAPRLVKVVDGDDAGGVTETTGWGGGGGFRFFNLAPSLLEKDKWGNWIVSRNYHPEMLAEAVCKLEGFLYSPDPLVFWSHGRSTERDFIYVTTQNLSRDQLQFISDQVGGERTLLICCAAFRAKNDDFRNLTVKKIPQAVLSLCEWGRDDYSLNVEELPATQAIDEDSEEPSAAGKAKASGASLKRGRRKSAAMQELPLFPLCQRE